MTYMKKNDEFISNEGVGGFLDFINGFLFENQ